MNSRLNVQPLTNSSLMLTATEDWKKLTVPQLKALCKDKKITGYSKLGKNALIQRLVEHVDTGSSNAVGSGLLTSISAVVALSSRQVASKSQVRITATSSPAGAVTHDLDLASLPPEQRVEISKHCIDQDQILEGDLARKSSPRGLTKTYVKPTNNDSHAGKHRHI